MAFEKRPVQFYKLLYHEPIREEMCLSVGNSLPRKDSGFNTKMLAQRLRDWGKDGTV